jgi:hypothetical protein
MIKTMTRFYPGREWGKYIPISVFLPWFFTEEGNSYRAKLLRAVSIFLVCFAAEIGLAFSIESISPTGAIDRKCSPQSESSAVTQKQHHAAVGAICF